MSKRMRHRFFRSLCRETVQMAPPRGLTMRRSVLMPVLAVLAATVMPLAASAGSGAPPAPNRAAVASASSFTLGGAKCSLIKVPAAARGTGGVPLTGAAGAANEGSLPVGVGSCPGVRPGAEVQTKIGLCTLNFLFETPDRQRFIGTAGHCILGEGPVADNAGEKLWPKGEGPVAKDSTGHRIGEFAYAVLQDPTDVSLIRLAPAVQAG